MNHLAKNLQRLLGERGITNSALARALESRGVGLHKTGIGRLLSGESKAVRLEVLHALCDVLNCTPNDLLLPGSDTQQLPDGHLHDLAMELDIARYQVDGRSAPFEDVLAVTPLFVKRCQERGLATFPEGT